MAKTIKDPLLKILQKIYEPGSLIERKMGAYDLSFQTDAEGRPVLLFIGKRSANGRISGERFRRRIVTDRQGRITKDYWEYKGSATAG